MSATCIFGANNQWILHEGLFYMKASERFITFAGNDHECKTLLSY